MKLTLELSKSEIEDIILNYAKKENGLTRNEVTIEWDEDHNLKITQDTSTTPTPTDREWLSDTNDGDEGNNDPD